MTLEEYAIALKTGDKSKIHEASLKRVMNHVSGKTTNSFGIVTSFRGSETKKVNLENNKKLGNMIRSFGYGFLKLDGHWNECSDHNIDYKDCPESEKSVVREPAYFIPNITKKEIIQLGKKFQQDSVVYKGPDTDGKIFLLSKSGSVLEKWNKLSVGNLSQGFSKIKGKSFTFEGYEWRPSGMFTNIALQALLK